MTEKGQLDFILKELDISERRSSSLYTVAATVLACYAFGLAALPSIWEHVKLNDPAQFSWWQKQIIMPLTLLGGGFSVLGPIALVASFVMGFRPLHDHEKTFSELVANAADTESRIEALRSRSKALWKQNLRRQHSITVASFFL